MWKSERLAARCAAVSVAFLSATVTGRSAEAALPPLMPAPAEFHPASGRLPIDAGFAFAIRGHDDSRLETGISRALRRWEARTGLTLSRTAVSDAAAATLVVECAGPGQSVPSLDEDESYELAIGSRQAVLRAPTVVGALRGLETLLQLLQADAQGYFVPAMAISDRPRFPWRGLMIDVARHWQPVEVIERNLDGMALVKLNVLHLHLTDDQGFRIESRLFPRLQEMGSDGHYFTQAQMREIIAYAQARGIRVVPEFDLPGHATSWLVGYPALGSAPGPYGIERHWGVFDPVLDPTNEAVYRLLDGFLGEMAELFPDPYVHMGGDENDGIQWNANPKIQEFIRVHGLHGDAGLQTYFSRRVSAILARHGKRMIGWDEILQPGLPKDSVIQSWRGPQALAAAARQGYRGILSNGYYIDLGHSAAEHYAVDPMSRGSQLSAEEGRRILGGEATMWSEWVTPETIDSRIWPRTAAIAERFWSPSTVNDIPDMYRRLESIDARLEEAGLLHRKNPPAMVRRLAGDGADPASLRALLTLVGLVEPAKDYNRGKLQPGSTQFTPLTGLADCAVPDSAEARKFAAEVERLLSTPARIDPALAGSLQHKLGDWAEAGIRVADILPAQAPRLRDAAPLGQALADSSRAGIEALAALVSGQPKSDSWRTAQLAILARAAEPNGSAAELAMIGPIKLLVAAAQAGH